jgi:hypothetical protein
MASKKPVKRRGSNKGQELERVRKISRRARAEVARLLKRNQSGTITRVQLQTGLKEVKEQLKQMDLHFYML